MARPIETRNRRLGTIAIVIVLFVGSEPFLAADEPPVDRQPVPDSLAQANAEKTIKTLFKSEYAKTTTSGRLRLGVALLEFAVTTTNDFASRYVLLRESADVASHAGDARTALTALELIGKDFQVEPLPMERKALETVMNAPVIRTGYNQIARAVFDLLDREVIGPDKFADAGDLLKIAKAAVEKSPNRQMKTIVDSLPAEIESLRREYDAIKSLILALKSQPDNITANDMYGRYLCFSKNDWPAGLPYLAKSADPEFKKAATLEISSPKSPAERKDLADQWWAISERYSGTADAQRRRNLQDRAVIWYLRAITGLSPLEQSTIAGRIVPAQSQTTAVTAMRQLPPEAQIREHVWSQGAGRIQTVRSDEGFCFLSGVAGKFEGGGETVFVSADNDGWWYFDGVSYQVISGRAISVQTPYRKLFKKEVKTFEWRPKDPPVKMISKYEGFCFLSGILGKFGGAGDDISVSVGPDNYWYLYGHTTALVQGKATCMTLVDPSAAQVKMVESTWKTGSAPVRLCNQNEGICFLSSVSGGLRGGGEDVRIYPGKDGYWHLGGSSYQDSLSLKAMSMIPLRTLPEKDRLPDD